MCFFDLVVICGMGCVYKEIYYEDLEFVLYFFFCIVVCCFGVVYVVGSCCSGCVDVGWLCFGW